MASNNYYGTFTHAGTQFGTQYTPAAGQYGAQQGYAQQYGTSPAAGGTSGYPASGGDQPYVIGGYTRPAAGQAGSSGYAGTGYGHTPTAGTTNKGSGTTFTNYDAAVYNAVSAYAQGATRTPGYGFKRGGGGGGIGQYGKKGPRIPPKPQTLHYCDVCKISCAGPQTYKEHLDGQKHKKKEALMKSGQPSVPKSGPAGLRCELCDVTCTGNDAYSAHIRGSKHQKVLKLHTKLGKPIPSDNPTVIPPGSTSSVPTPLMSASVLKKVPITPTQTTPFLKPAAPAPKISFVGAKTEGDRYLHVGPVAEERNKSNGVAVTNTSSGTGSTDLVDASSLSTSYPLPSLAPVQPASNSVPQDDEMAHSAEMNYMEKEIEPVGMDYIEEVRTDDGKGVTFNCKLCDCKFNDPNAKEMHMKGRRHRLQYKKKVDPNLIVDIKPSSRQRKIEDRRGVRNTTGNRRGLGHVDRMKRNNMDSESMHYSRGPLPLLPPGPRGFGPGPKPLMFAPPQPTPFYMVHGSRHTESRDDHHVMEKHNQIYPTEDELQVIQHIVSSTERALKFVSDEIAEYDAKASLAPENPMLKQEPGPTDAAEVIKQPEHCETKPDIDLQAFRVLKGVMRVGNLAKGLLLKGDTAVQLAVLCSVKPTVTLLQRVLASLPKHLEIVSPEMKLELKDVVKESGLIVTCESEPKIEVMVTFTSPLVRAAEGGKILLMKFPVKYSIPWIVLAIV